MNQFALISTDFAYQLSLFGLIALYTIVGVTLMIGCVVICNWLLRVDLRKELVKDQNPAIGTMFAGLFVAIAIIIAASIAG